MQMMRGFEFRLCLSVCLSVCLSLFLSLSLRAGVLLCGCRLPSFDLDPLSRNLSFIAIGSNCIFFVFLSRRSRIGRKIHFNYFYFLTNFIDISLRADPMCRSSFFHFEESLSTDNIR